MHSGPNALKNFRHFSLKVNASEVKLVILPALFKVMQPIKLPCADGLFSCTALKNAKKMPQKRSL